MFDLETRVSSKSFRLLAIAGLLLALLALPTLGQPGGESPREAALIDQLSNDFDVLPVSGGWVLTPRDSEASWRSIEVRGGEIFLDGRETSPGALADLLGEDTAGGVLELAETIGRETSAETEPAPAKSVPDEIEELEEDDSWRRENRRIGDVVTFGSIKIHEGESARDAVAIGGGIEIEGEIRGDAVAIGGPIEISGRLGRTATSVGGSIYVEEDAEVDGDLISVGGRVNRDSGARVRGSIQSLPFLGGGIDLHDWGFGRWFWHPRGFGYWGDLLDEVLETFLLVVLALVIVAFARRMVGSVAERAEREPWKAGFVGFLAQVLFLPAFFLVCLILLVSIIGIPILVLLLIVAPVAICVILLLGFTGVSLSLGQWLRGRFDLSQTDVYGLVFLGVLLIKGWTLLGEALSFVPLGPIYVTAILVLLLGVVIQYAAWTVGLGAFLLHKLQPAPVLPAAAETPALPAEGPSAPPPEAPEA